MKDHRHSSDELEATIILHGAGSSRRYNLDIAMLYFYFYFNFWVSVFLNLDVFHITISFDDVFPNYLLSTITMAYG